MARNRNIEMTSAEHDSALLILSSKGATVAETDAILASLNPNHTREELSQVLKGWFKTRPKWSYSQRATWDGAQDQSFINNQLLDTVAEGVEDGALLITVLDGAVSVENNKLKFTTQTTPAWNAQGGRYTNAVTRVLGKALFATINIFVLGANGFMLGWSSSTDVNWSGLKRRAYWISGTVTKLLINLTGSGGNPALVSPVLIDTDYELVIVLGGFDSDGDPYYSGQDPSLYLFGAQLFRKAAGVWMLDWVDHKEDTSPMYPVWTNHSSAGTVKPFNVPTRDYRTVLIPAHFSSFNAVVGTSLDQVTPEVGAPFILSGLWDVQPAGATTQGAVPGGPAFLAISEINASDVFLRTWITPVAGETGGIISRYFNEDNLLAALISPNNNDFRVWQRLLGTWGQIGPTVSMTINAGVEYMITMRILGNRIIAMVDDANTIDVLTVINPTFSKHGLRTNTAGTSFKRFIGYPLKSLAYNELDDN